MNKIKTLMLMQLKDKFNLSLGKTKKMTFLSICLQIIKFVVITLALYTLLNIIVSLNILSLNGNLPIKFFSIIFSFLFVLSIGISSINLMKHLFLSKDNIFLLTLPVNKIKVFTSKLIVFCIYEFIRNILFFIPLLICYGAINRITFLYYIWLLPATLLLTLFICSISAVLCVGLYYLIKLIKKYRLAEIIITCLFFTLFIIFTILIINAVPSNFDIFTNWSTIYFQVQDLINNIVIALPFIYYLTVAFTGSNLGLTNYFFNTEQILSLFIIILISGLLFTAAIFIIKPLFFKLAGSSNEKSKKATPKAGKNIKLSPFMTELKKELILSTRSSNRLINLVMLAIALPLAILLMVKITTSMNTNMNGQSMAFAFSILIVLLFSLSTNAFLSKVLSQDGDAAYLLKSSPTRAILPITARGLINFGIMTLSILISTIIIGTLSNFSVLDTFFTFLIIEAIYLSHLLNSIIYDVTNPKNEQYSSIDPQIYNSNEIRSTFTAFIISGLVAFLAYFFMNENQSNWFWKVAIFVGIYLFISLYMYISKIKVYFKEGSK